MIISRVRLVRKMFSNFLFITCITQKTVFSKWRSCHCFRRSNSLYWNNLVSTTLNICKSTISAGYNLLVPYPGRMRSAIRYDWRFKNLRSLLTITKKILRLFLDGRPKRLAMFYGTVAYTYLVHSTETCRALRITDDWLLILTVCLLNTRRKSIRVLKHAVLLLDDDNNSGLRDPWLPP